MHGHKGCRLLLCLLWCNVRRLFLLRRPTPGWSTTPHLSIPTPTPTHPPPRARQVELLRDPVTGLHSGQAVVQFESAERVELVATNLREMVFLFNGTPRPLEAAPAQPGGLRGPAACWAQGACYA